ncbi:unnamed protein product [Linum tenue]|uniref:Uncharacterized protein n=1 Tax=Linum tenue TaxID=586396 RepID=A0AAV0RTD7_9ROSI|nr:unnamed protein product [Linum tenue]
MESEFGWGHSTARRLRRWRMTRRHFRCGEPGRYSISGGKGGGVAGGHGLQPPDGGGGEEGCSPVIALKRKHSLRRKMIGKGKKDRAHHHHLNMVVLEDLGADYLEELLMTTSDYRQPVILIGKGNVRKRVQSKQSSSVFVGS